MTGERSAHVRHGAAASVAWILVAALGLALGCGDDDTPMDGGAGADVTSGCAGDSDCDDGLFCNGTEACRPDDDAADEQGCVAGTSPCLGECDEAGGRCEPSGCETPDGDGDGALSVECGGSDCDDADPRRYPGNEEVCDPMNVDEDCDPRTFGFRDQDRDGSADGDCCNEDSGELRCGTDCDDTHPAVSLTSPEMCDTIDNDCDGATDEMATLEFFRDMDGDSFGDPDAPTVMGCSPPAGYVFNSTDCDDGNPSVHPAAFDRCDASEIDDDCSGTANDPPGGCECAGAETRACVGCPGGECVGECVGSTQTCVDGAWSGCSDAPGAETCDGRDEDCDGTTDEGFPFVAYYLDTDGDDYGDPSTEEVSCGGPPPGDNWVTSDDDCYDRNDDARPTQTGYFSTHRGDGSFDYDCDGGERERTTASGFCTYEPSIDRCLFRVGYVGGRRPACGETFDAITSCTRSGPSSCATGMGTGVQECR